MFFIRFLILTYGISLYAATELPEKYLIVFRHGPRANHAFFQHLNHLIQNSSTISPILTRDDVANLRRIGFLGIEGFLGETLWNSYRNQHGWQPHDPGLSTLEEPTFLIESVHELIRLGARPSVIISSPYLRTLETAEIIRRIFLEEAHHLLEIVIDDQLGEWPYAHAPLPNHDPTNLPNHRRGYPNNTPRNWDRNVLRQETTQGSGITHARRVQGVLQNYLQSNPGAIIVGHQMTVTAAFPEQLWRPQRSIEQGGFVIAGGDGLSVYHRFSRGVQFRPPEETLVEPAPCLIRFSGLNNLEYQLEAYYGRIPLQVIIPEHLPGAAIVVIQNQFPRAQILRLTRHLRPENYPNALVIEESPAQEECCGSNESCSVKQ